MDSLVFSCNQCKKECQLNIGTTRMGAEKLAKEHGDDWLSIVRQKDGETVKEFISCINEIHAGGSTCKGSICLADRAILC